jgi:hypothetical protein
MTDSPRANARAPANEPRVCSREGLDPGGAKHTAPRKYHDEIISLAFIHTKSGEPIVIMVFRRAVQKVLCSTPPS